MLARLGERKPITLASISSDLKLPEPSLAEPLTSLCARGLAEGRASQELVLTAAGAATRSEPAGTTAAVQTLTEVGEVRSMLAASDQLAPNGIIVGPSSDLQGVVARFLVAVAHHRFWGRPNLQHVPA